MRLALRNLKHLTVLASLGLVASPVFAATTTSNLDVKITIRTLCLAGATTAVDFGSHGLLNTDTDQTGTVSVTCTNGTSYTVGLGVGGGTGATITDRRMNGPGGATVLYHLYRDTNRTLNWGDIGGADVQGGTGNGSLQSLTVYGRVPIQTTPAAGDYTDTVLVTFSY
jgi:spore coat protein U-like protein